MNSHTLADKKISTDPVRSAEILYGYSHLGRQQMKDQITINVPDGAFGAYIVRPEALPAPAVVVLQELFGVNADIRKHCDELAEQGFIAAAPDLFWRQEPGVDINPR